MLIQLYYIAPGGYRIVFNTIKRDVYFYYFLKTNFSPRQVTDPERALLRLINVLGETLLLVYFNNLVTKFWTESIKCLNFLIVVTNSFIVYK